MTVTNYIWDVENDSNPTVENDSYPTVEDDGYLMETDESDVTTAVYTNEPGEFGSVVSQRRASNTSTYHYDGLGSTRALTDSTETVSDTYIYSAFGETVSETGTTINPFRYVGEKGYYYDSETEDYYIRARTYDPVNSRWISQDPLLFSDGNNFYTYVKNSPVNNYDPSGELIFSACAVIGAGVILIFTSCGCKPPSRPEEPLVNCNSKKANAYCDQFDDHSDCHGKVCGRTKAKKICYCYWKKKNKQGYGDKCSCRKKQPNPR